MRIFKHTILSSVAALTLTGGMTVSAFATSTPPEPSAAKTFKLPKINSFVMDNGVKVTMVPYGRVPKVTIRAVIEVGNLNDDQQTWLSDLTANMMEEGAGGKSASDIALAASEMGGSVNIGVGFDQTTARMDVLSESASEAIKLLADVVQRPDLPASEFERVKNSLIRDLSVGESRPQGTADKAFYAALFPNHPYGKFYPSKEQLEAYSLEDVKAFHADNFGGKRTHIYVVGQFDKAAVKSALEEAFGEWQEGPDVITVPSAENENPSLILIDRPGAPQSTLRLGKRVPVFDGDIKANAMNTLLGGYFSSRITRNIREDKGYTYSPFSGYSSYRNGRKWQQSADVTAEATGPALSEILMEIDRMRSEPPTEKEVKGIKNYMSGVHVIQLASRGGLAGRLANANLFGLGPQYLENYVSKVQELTAEDFTMAAKDYLNTEEMTWVIVGPLDEVRPQLTSLEDRLPPEEN